MFDGVLHRNTPPILTKMVEINSLCSAVTPALPARALPRGEQVNASDIQTTDGLHLLSLLAERAQRNSVVDEIRTPSPDINKNYNAPKSFNFEDEDFARSTVQFLRHDSDEVFQPQWTSNIFKISTEPDCMDAMELDYRVRLAEIQRKYKEKQRELAKLHHKKSDDQRYAKRKPGRPKKRKSRKSSSASKSDTPCRSEKGMSDQEIISESSPRKRAKSSTRDSTDGTVKKSAQNSKPKSTPSRPVKMNGKSSRTPSKDSSVGFDSRSNDLMAEDQSHDTLCYKGAVSTDKVPSDTVPNHTVASPSIEKAECFQSSQEFTEIDSGDSAHSSVLTSSDQQWDEDDYDSTPDLGLLARYASNQVEITQDNNMTTSGINAPDKHKRKAINGSSVEDDEETPAKKRKPGRPKRFDEESVTETIVAKKPKNFSFFSYGNSKGYGSAFRKSGNKTTLGSKTSGLGNKTTAFGSKSSSFNSKSTAFGSKSSVFGSKTTGFGSKLSSFGNKSSSFNSKSSAFGSKNSAFGSKSSALGTKTSTFGSKSSTSNKSKLESRTGFYTSDWYRRRSERIFISESLHAADDLHGNQSPSNQPLKSPSSHGLKPSNQTENHGNAVQNVPLPSKQSSRPSNIAKPSNRPLKVSMKTSTSKATSLALKNKNSRERSSAQSAEDLSQKVKKLCVNKTSATAVSMATKSTTSSVADSAVKLGNENVKVSPALEPLSKSSSSSSDTDTDSDSSSEADNLPLIELLERSVTPEPRSCKLQKEDLADNLSVLFFMEGLLYEGTLHAIQPPDIYGVVIEGERGSRPHILPTEDLLEQAVLDVKAPSARFLSIGTRVCAYWSQAFSCLYPGCIYKGSPNPHADPDLVSVEFDDGDTGTIPMEHIRMLPQDFPIQDLDTNPPIMMVGNRKRRNTADDVLCADHKDRKPPINESPKHHPVSDETKQRRKSVNKPSKNKESTAEKSTENKDGSSKTPSKGKASAKVVTPTRVKVESSKNKSDLPAKRSERSLSLPAKVKGQGHVVERSMSLSKPKLGRGHMTTEDSQSDSSNDDDDSMATSSQSGDSDSLSESEDEEYVPGSDTMSVGKNRRASDKDGKSSTKVISPRKQQQDPLDQMLPLQQLWQWVGKGTKRPGMKGKARREYFKSLRRGSEIVNVGDCAVFLSAGRTLPYIGRIVSLWQSWGGNMVVKVKWFYHPEETKGGKKLADIRGALYQSPHVDENDVQTISHKCELLSFIEWKVYRSRRRQECQQKGVPCDLDENIYYLAGTYDPTIGMITFQPDVKLI